MTPSLWVGTNCWYWARSGDKPIAAIVTAFNEGDGIASLMCFTEDGGRFHRKAVPPEGRPGREGWSQIGQTFH